MSLSDHIKLLTLYNWLLFIDLYNFSCYIIYIYVWYLLKCNHTFLLRFDKLKNIWTKKIVKKSHILAILNNNITCIKTMPPRRKMYIPK